MVSVSSDPRDDPRFFVLAQAILRGHGHDERDVGVAKLLWLVLVERGSDIWIDERAIMLRFVGAVEIHRYFLSLAPGVVWDLMGRLGASRIQTPMVGTLRASGTRLSAHIPSRAPRDMIGWVVPTPEQIVILTRPIGEAGECELQDIPDAGPWALPTVADPIHHRSRTRDPGRERVFVEFAEPMPCPHCRTPSSAYRRLDSGWLVCANCGRSFDPNR